jgi:hypothetical protein
VHASDTAIRRLGEHQACSRECLMKLIADWAEVWRARKAKRAS